MKFMIPFLMAAVLPASALAQSQAGSQSPSGAQTQPAGGSGVPSIAIPKTTEVIVIETPKQGVTPQQVMAVIPEEIKATVKLYLDGKIRQWYSRGDGKGVVFEKPVPGMLPPFCSCTAFRRPLICSAI